MDDFATYKEFLNSYPKNPKTISFFSIVSIGVISVLLIGSAYKILFEKLFFVNKVYKRGVMNIIKNIENHESNENQTKNPPTNIGIDTQETNISAV
uniref:Col_cuticle_N domain-containing protein n=1 Tax=Parastrongyloides trichosuri TaxID=131310 RepID=A0A0N4ZQI5_PARTI